MNKLVTLVAAASIAGATALATPNNLPNSQKNNLEHKLQQHHKHNKNHQQHHKTFYFQEPDSTKYGFIEREMGDYVHGRVVIPEGVIIYQYKVGGPENTEMKEYLKDVQDMKLEYKLEQFTREKGQHNPISDRERREEYHKNMERFQEKMKEFDVDIGPQVEKEMERHWDVYGYHMEERFERYAQRIEEKAEAFEAYMEQLEEEGRPGKMVGEAVKIIGPMIRWAEEMEEWGEQIENGWAKEFEKFMEQETIQKQYDNGETYIFLPQFNEPMPLPPECPLPDYRYKTKR